MIAFFYTGEKRFNDVTKDNHKKFFDKVKEFYDVSIYDHTQPGFDRLTCPFKYSGIIQAWDFLKSRDIIKEEIIVKIRSDIWFTNSATNVVIHELKEIVEGRNELCYIGMNLSAHYNQEHTQEDAKKIKKVTDFLIIANKKSIKSTDSVIQHFNPDDPKTENGNRIFKSISIENAKTKSVSCQMYLVRQEFNDPDNFEIYLDWARRYKNHQHCVDWIENNKERINQL